MWKVMILVLLLSGCCFARQTLIENDAVDVNSPYGKGNMKTKYHAITMCSFFGGKCPTIK